jgi:uncharacterized protein (TIGR02569 family)
VRCEIVEIVQPQSIPEEIIQSFGLSLEDPKFLGGTDRSTFRVGNTVLKRMFDPREAEWVADAYLALQNPELRLPKPISSRSGKFAVNGWIAYNYLEGDFIKQEWDKKLRIGRRFNELANQLIWPNWMDQKRDPWSHGHRVAWGREPIPAVWSPIAKSTLANMLDSCVGSNDQKSQVIHCDLPGNIIFSKFGDGPGVIDFSPGYGPLEYSNAIFFVDVCAWENASKLDFRSYAITDVFQELLVRATIFRLAVVAQLDQENGSQRFTNELKNWSTALTLFQ